MTALHWLCTGAIPANCYWHDSVGFRINTWRHLVKMKSWTLAKCYHVNSMWNGIEKSNLYMLFYSCCFFCCWFFFFQFTRHQGTDAPQGYSLLGYWYHSSWRGLLISVAGFGSPDLGQPLVKNATYVSKMDNQAFGKPFHVWLSCAPWQNYITCFLSLEK